LQKEVQDMKVDGNRYRNYRRLLEESK
jgi:hypothetical protein